MITLPATVWQTLQARELQAYRAAYRERGHYWGFFSEPGYAHAEQAGRRIAEACPTCLDIGSGVLPHPAYMQAPTVFYGLDPFFGEGPRAFAFTQAVGEALPFPQTAFPCVSFMSTLDHQQVPLLALQEAYRVLQTPGRLYIWTLLYGDTDTRWQWWQAQPPGTLFDPHHQYAFTLSSLQVLLAQAGFAYLGVEGYTGTATLPPSWLIVALKEH